MFGKSKAVEVQAPPATKIDNAVNAKNAAINVLNPPPVKTPDTKYAANFSRLKRSARKSSRGIF